MSTKTKVVLVNVVLIAGWLVVLFACWPLALVAGAPRVTESDFE